MESKKELTGLEALEVMLGYASFNERYYEHKGEDPYAVIKKDLDKLEKLKNLEKELGIDLPTFFKALKKGIYITKDGYINTFKGNHEYNSNQKYTCLVLYYSNVDDCFYLMDIQHPYGDPDSGDIGCYVKVKDYGKTWALTREELEND